MKIPITNVPAAAAIQQPCEIEIPEGIDNAMDYMAGVMAERERCAKIADDHCHDRPRSNATEFERARIVANVCYHRIGIVIRSGRDYRRPTRLVEFVPDDETPQ